MSERQKFEDNWKSAFDGAETTPPDRVWSSIELDLAGQESAAMKKKIVYWQRMAAVFLLFALLTGVYAFYPRAVDNNQLVKNTEVNQSRANEELHIAKSDDHKNDQSNKNHKKDNVGESTTPVAKDAVVMASTSSPSYFIPKSLLFPQTLNSKLEIRNVLPETIEATVTEETEKKDEQVAIVLPVAEEQPEEIVEPKKRSGERNLWVALGAAAGNYSPNTPSAVSTSQGADFGTSLSPANLSQASQKSEPKVGTSYSFGLAVGKKFGRIVVQTGVNVGKQQIEYSSNYTAQTASNSAKAASSDYLKTGIQSYSMSATNTYTVNSTMEIISIPVQAGYMIIDRRLGWQFNAGVSPDFFIRNVLTDESGQREKFTQSAGSGSPYRSVNWSGLLNTELSYRIGTHYRLSFVPGVRYSFNSILKEPTSNGRPVIMDVGFRFRYLFD